MLPKELFKKIKRIEITTSRLVTDVFAGAYHSVFKGQGIEFDEVREYQPGDDVRTIDWNVTARTGKAHIKKFVEERELSVIILVDASRSSRFATVNVLKSQLAAEISAVLALSAIRNNDKVGAVFFTDEIELFIPPQKGSQHVLRLIREVLYFKPEKKKTDITAALDYLSRVTNRKSIVFLISDFIGMEEQEDQLRRKLAVVNKRHDVIAVTLNDPKELTLPDVGLVELQDAEEGGRFYLDTSSPAVRKQYHSQNLSRIKKREQLFKSLGIDFIDLSTDSSYVDELVKFFIKRRKR